MKSYITLLVFLLLGISGCKEKDEPIINTNKETDAYSGVVNGNKPYSSDKYEFPSEWKQFNTIPERINALQIPDGILASISTEGLVETCLEFPYLTDVFFYNNFQQGFEELSKEFNGFQELFKRPGAVNALIGKYAHIRGDISNTRSKSDMEKGKFSFRHFVLELMLAQDAVIEALSAEQEKQLFLLSFEHKDIKKGNPDIFSDVNALPTYLLYAKKMRNDNAANDAVLMFIGQPSSIDQSIIADIERYVNGKYK